MSSLCFYVNYIVNDIDNLKNKPLKKVTEIFFFSVKSMTGGGDLDKKKKYQFFFSSRIYSHNINSEINEKNDTNNRVHFYIFMKVLYLFFLFFNLIFSSSAIVLTLRQKSKRYCNNKKSA